MLNTWYKQMAATTRSLDIVSFDGNGWVNPDQRFIGLLHNTIQNLANSKRQITVRILFGVPFIGFSSSESTITQSMILATLLRVHDLG